MSFNHPPVFALAEKWCQQHPGWQRFCDCTEEVSSTLTLTFKEQEAACKRYWRRKYGRDAERAWQEFASVYPTRFRTGYIADDGRFYENVVAAMRRPDGTLQTSMMVVHVGGEQGRWLNGKKS